MEIREAVLLWVPHFCENVGGSAFLNCHLRDERVQ